MQARVCSVLFFFALWPSSAGGAPALQDSPGVTEELYGAYNFLLEVSGSSGKTIIGGFKSVSGMDSETEVVDAGKEEVASLSAGVGAKAVGEVALERGFISSSDLDSWKAAILRSGLLVLSRREGGRAVCRWELRSPRILGVRGVNVRDGAELRLPAS